MRVAAVVPAAIIGAALAVALTQSSSSPLRPPPLPRTALAGAPVTLTVLRGRPALIDFFASWCGPCSKEASAVERAARSLRGRAHVVAVDWSDSRPYALQFITRYRWTFPVLSDPNGASGNAYGIEALPSAFVLDAGGHVVKRLLGPQTASALVHAVTESDSH
jgi:cytochrome c biogenesis protein CcmG, thiol:disulfide interchange protein DsbE